MHLKDINQLRVRTQESVNKLKYSNQQTLVGDLEVFENSVTILWTMLHFSLFAYLGPRYDTSDRGIFDVLWKLKDSQFNLYRTEAQNTAKTRSTGNLGQCIPPPRHVVPMSRYQFRIQRIGARSPPKFNQFAHCQSLKIARKSVRKFLCKVANKQTKKTMKT